MQLRLPEIKIRLPRVHIEKIDSLKLIIVSNEGYEIVDAVRQSDGSIVTKNKERVYRPPVNLKPRPVRIGKRTYLAYIVHRDYNVFYEPEEINDKELAEKMKKAKLSMVMLNPRSLATYIVSKSIDRVLKPLRVTRGEALAYVFMGMVLVFLLEFFILPMLGYKIIIGPAR